MLTKKQVIEKYGKRNRLNVSDGNLKLVSNATTRFIVWNLPAVITCPNATELCKKYCYAKKAEIRFPEDVGGYRHQNLIESRKADFVENMTFTILDIAAGTKKKYIVVRIHESGDFYNKKYTTDWLQIMENCKVDNRIKFIAYTKSFKFFDGVKLPKNFALRASIWADTKQADIETIKRNDWNIYTAVDQFQRGDNFTRCRCKDCATCKKCWQNYRDIRCEIH